MAMIMNDDENSIKDGVMRKIVAQIMVVRYFLSIRNHEHETCSRSGKITAMACAVFRGVRSKYSSRSYTFTTASIIIMPHGSSPARHRAHSAYLEASKILAPITPKSLCSLSVSNATKDAHKYALEAEKSLAEA
jgi:hypothetical protein